MSQLSNTYGGRSGAATPAMRSITKNDVPRIEGSGSCHRTVGNGISPRAPTMRMARAWRSRSYSGNNGNASGGGGRRSTNWPDSFIPARTQKASNSNVSLERPAPDGPPSNVIRTSPSAARRSPSHRPSVASSDARSRVDVRGRPAGTAGCMSTHPDHIDAKRITDYHHHRSGASRSYRRRRARIIVLTDQDLVERVDALVAANRDHLDDQVAFRGAEFDAGLAMVALSRGARRARVHA